MVTNFLGGGQFSLDDKFDGNSPSGNLPGSFQGIAIFQGATLMGAISLGSGDNFQEGEAILLLAQENLVFLNNSYRLFLTMTNSFIS